MIQDNESQHFAGVYPGILLLYCIYCALQLWFSGPFHELYSVFILHAHYLKFIPDCYCNSFCITIFCWFIVICSIVIFNTVIVLCYIVHCYSLHCSLFFLVFHTTFESVFCLFTIFCRPPHPYPLCDDVHAISELFKQRVKGWNKQNIADCKPSMSVC